GGIMDEAKLVLLGDVALPFGGNTFTIKGGYDENTGASKSLTYVIIDCKGFRELSINGELKLSRSIVQPFDEEKRAPKPGNVIIPILTIARGFDDIFTTVNVPTFCVTGLNNFGFAIRNATIDFSDERHPAGAIFPKINKQDYFAAFGEPDVKLWRGLYVRSFEILFPKEFLLKGGRKITAKAENFILDRNGTSTLIDISVTKGSPPPSTLADGRAGKWKMSITDLYLEIVTNKVQSGGLGGEMVLPISNVANSSNGGDKLKYTAIISKDGRFDFTVANVSRVSFGMFGLAQATIAPGSIINLAIYGGKIRPRAVLTGSINIKNAATSETDTASTELNGIVFRDLVLQDTVPKISASYFGYQKPSNTSNFPMSLDKLTITLVDPSKPISNPEAIGALCKPFLNPTGKRIYAVISVKTSVSLDSSFGGSAGFNILGYIDEDPATEEDFVKYECMKMTNLCVKANFSGFSMSAGFQIVAGKDKGFEGQISLTLKKPEIKICATGRFTKDAAGLSHWFIDGGAVFSPGIPVGAIKITSIGGALYRRMIPGPPGSELDVSVACVSCVTGGNTGVGYVNDNDVALGFRAVVGVQGSGKAFKGEAGFEVRFTESWGFLSIGLFGRGELAPPDILPSALGELKGKFSNFAAKAVEDKPKMKKLLDKASMNSNVSQIFGNIPPNGVPNKLSFDFSLLLDMKGGRDSTVLHGEANIYVNMGSGSFVGRGAKARAGWVALHFEPGLWYIHAGSPTDKLGLRMATPLAKAEVGSYFMVGHNIPPVGPLPAQMQALLSASDKAKVRQGNQESRNGDVALGTGIAFGADLSLSTGDIQVLLFYANLSAGMGLDVQMKKQGVCNVDNGGNGWYAYGRMYAYMMGDIGIKFKILFKPVKVSIFQGGAGILLEGGLPNPAWFTGTMAGNYRVLNGLVKGSFRMDVEIGKKQCKL
ncbi:MAG: hypothetical protein ACRCVT_01930, partial [Leadbetterella sp.]